ncbi:putative glycoside hydrolase [Alteromonadaceae bacterium BrNp21-10]|nr:putative glycoside hydrolase [Alteromonadaceae bacterium BrNp21-10]
MKLTQRTTSSIAILKWLIASLLLLNSSQLIAQDQLNSQYFYFMNGNTVGGWGLTLGDKQNWVLPVANKDAVSADKQLTISTSTYKTDGDAINLKWSRKKGKGQFAIYGSAVDLSEVAHRIAITMEIKVITKPKKSVTLGMDCGYPCRGEMHIQDMLRQLPKDEWILFPIPLDCFTTKGLDASKINAPFILASDGRFEADIANIRMELLPEGSPTCAGQ